MAKILTVLFSTGTILRRKGNGTHQSTHTKLKRSAPQGRVWREEEALEVAADGFGVAGVEVRDEEEGDAEDDEGDEAVGALLAPDVEDDNFGDADEEEAEAGEAEATFRDDKSEEEGGDGFEAPADGDAALGDFVEDEDGDENRGEEEIDLFGAAEEIGEVDGKIVGGRGPGVLGGEAFAQGEGEGLAEEEERGGNGDIDPAIEVAGDDDLEGKSAEENEEGDDDAVVEEDAAPRGPGDADEEQGERGPGYDDPAIVEIGARKENQRCGAQIGKGGSGQESPVEGEIFCGGRTFGEACEAEIGVIKNEGDWQPGEQQLARAEIEIEVGEAQKTESERGVGLRAPVERFPVHTEREKKQAEERPAKGDGVYCDFVINQRDNQ